MPSRESKTKMIANSEDKANARADVRPADDGGRARRDRGNHSQRHGRAGAPRGRDQPGRHGAHRSDRTGGLFGEPTGRAVARRRHAERQRLGRARRRRSPGSDGRRAAGTDVGSRRSSARARARLAREAVGVLRPQRAQHHPGRVEGRFPGAGPRVVAKPASSATVVPAGSLPAPAVPILVPAALASRSHPRPRRCRCRGRTWRSGSSPARSRRRSSSASSRARRLARRRSRSSATVGSRRRA